MKLKTVYEIRRPLRELVPDAFYRMDPQESFQGSEDAVRLWTEEPEAGLAQAPDAAMEESLEQVFEFGAEIDSDNLTAALGGTEGERIHQSVMMRGVDALAFYVTLHAEGTQWGIYVPISSILYLGRMFKKPEVD